MPQKSTVIVAANARSGAELARSVQSWSARRRLAAFGRCVLLGEPSESRYSATVSLSSLTGAGRGAVRECAKAQRRVSARVQMRKPLGQAAAEAPI